MSNKRSNKKSNTARYKVYTVSLKPIAHKDLIDFIDAQIENLPADNRKGSVYLLQLIEAHKRRKEVERETDGR